MQFGNDPLTSLDDATYNFEQLQNLGILNVTLDMGTSTFAWTVNQNASDVLTIPHNLGTIPNAYTGIAQVGSSSNVQFTVQAAAAPDSVNLYLQMVASVAQAIGQACPAVWIAAAQGL